MSFELDPKTGLSIPACLKPVARPGSRENVAELLKQEVARLLIEATTPHDQVFHANIVAAGQFTWRVAFQRQFGACFDGNRAQADHLADVAFMFISKKWVQMYPGLSASDFLDKVHVPSPLSEKEQEKEIDDAWTLEIAGSEAGMRAHYEGSARTRSGADLGHKVTNVGKVD